MISSIAVNGAVAFKPGSGLVLPPASITSLVTTLGGTSQVTAAYNCTQGITLSSGAVSSWADVTSTGPALTQATQIKMPVQQADGALVFTASASMYLQSVATAGFVLSGTAGIIYVGSIYGAAGTQYGCGLADASSPTTLLGVAAQSGTGTYIGKSGNPITTIDSTIAYGTTPRVIGVGCNTFPSVSVQVANHAAQTHSITANSATSPQLTVGGYFQVSGASNSTCYGLFFLTRIPTLADLQAVAAVYTMTGAVS